MGAAGGIREFDFFGPSEGTAAVAGTGWRHGVGARPLAWKSIPQGGGTAFFVLAFLADEDQWRG